MRLSALRTALALVALLLAVWLAPLGGNGPVAAQEPATTQLHLPLITTARAEPVEPEPLDCRIEDNLYEQLRIEDAPSDPPAHLHPDLNLALRGYEPVTATLDLVEYGGGSDPGAPQLTGLFADEWTPTFTAAYQVHQWDWECDCPAAAFEPPFAEWPVTLLGLESTVGEPVRVPDRQGGALSPAGHKVLVLYADASRLTLKYTREDNVRWGYTLHLENLCVDPALLALYERLVAETGRRSLPALYGGQPVGHATSSDLGVAIRDTGYWMDPRSRKDWWR